MNKMMTIRPPANLHDNLKNIAKSKGHTLNQLVLQILWQWLETQKEK